MASKDTHLFLAPGTPVRVASEYDGVIRQVCFGLAGTLYEVGWFIGGERQTAWLNESEFTTESVARARIGFKE